MDFKSGHRKTVTSITTAASGRRSARNPKLAVSDLQPPVGRFGPNQFREPQERRDVELFGAGVGLELHLGENLVDLLLREVLLESAHDVGPQEPGVDPNAQAHNARLPSRPSASARIRWAA